MQGGNLGSAGFFAYHGVTREFYESKDSEYRSNGFSLESLSSFKDCAGRELYNANWFKKTPVPWDK